MSNSVPPPRRETSLDGASASPEPSPAGPPATGGATPRIPSSTLFGGGRRIIIAHGGREYSLLITRQGKLVLNRC